MAIDRRAIATRGYRPLGGGEVVSGSQPIITVAFAHGDLEISGGGTKAYFGVGDEDPPLGFRFLDAEGENLDISGASVKFSMVDADGTAKVDAQSCTITSAEDGEGEYRWDATDLDTAGEYQGQFLITWAGGDEQTVPLKENLFIIVKERVN